MRLHPLLLVAALHLGLASADHLNQRHVLHARQQTGGTTGTGPVTPPPSATGGPATTSSTTSSTTTSTPDLPGPPPGAGSTTSPTTTTGSGSTTTTATTTTPTGPPPLDTGTAIPPLANITLGMPTKAPLPVTALWGPGMTPPVPGAPPLPTALALGNWPPFDQVPPTDTPEVRAWMKELEGHNIPDFPPTRDGSCANDTAAAAAAPARGWWTCGGHTRPTDIVACPDKYTWGVSFDDGPSPYTQVLLNFLQEKNLKSTFFVVGSRVVERPNLVIQEYMQGHEISVHTWSHRPLTSLTTEQIVAELGWTRRAIKQAIGVTPTTMRPPYGDIDDRVRAISLAMGMVPIMWTTTPSGGKFDTNDWRVAAGNVNGTDSYNTFQEILTAATALDTGFIVLQHDLFEITVDLAVGYTLDAALNHNPKFDLKPIGQCSNIPPGNLYLESNRNETFPYRDQSKAGVDVDGDGKLDTASGNATPIDGSKSAGFITSAPIATSLSIAVAAVFALAF